MTDQHVPRYRRSGAHHEGRHDGRGEAGPEGVHQLLEFGVVEGQDPWRQERTDGQTPCEPRRHANSSKCQITIIYIRFFIIY